MLGKVSPSQTMNLTDQFLIAMPGLTDPNFHQAVAYICVHSKEGAMGIIINRPLDSLVLGDVLSQLKLKPVTSKIHALQVFHGGPVQRDRGFVLHRPTCEWESTIRTSDEIGVTTSSDILKAIAGGGGPEESLVALGYAGWGEGQLEYELAENTWLCAPADSQVIFCTPSEKRWAAAIRLLGFDPKSLCHISGHA